MRREAAANPAKAGALAIVLVVAIWFWVPLVVHWCSPPAAPSGKAAAAGAPPNATPDNGAKELAASSATLATASSANWQDLDQTIEQDRRMRPNVQLSGWRDPFGPSAAALAAEKTMQQHEQQQKQHQVKKRAPPPDLLPADAGLVLNSTLVGSGPRMALIGGEPYWEGDMVPAPSSSDGFRVAEIYPRQVVLQRHGKQYNLEIKVSQRAGQDEPVASNAAIPHAENTIHVHTRGAASRGKAAAVGN
jgi:hypothetical protein